MKKKKKNIIVKKESSFRIDIYKFLKKPELILFLSVFIFSLINNYTAKPINPLGRVADDPYYYYLISKQVKEKIYNNFFNFIGGILFDSLTQRDYQEMGFVENDIQSIFRAPAIVFFYGFIFSIFGDSFHTILITNSILFALTILLIYKTSEILYKNNEYIKWLISGIALFYLPFHSILPFILCEPGIIFFITLTIFLYILSLERKRPFYFFLTGGMIYITALAKVSIQYLSFFLFAFLIFLIIIDYKKPERNKILKNFIAGFILVLFIWKFISYRATGDFDLTSVTWKKVTDASMGRVGWTGISPHSEGVENNFYRDHTIYFREAASKVKLTQNVWFDYSYAGKEAIMLALKSELLHIVAQSIRKMVFLIFTPMQSITTLKNYYIFKFLLGIPNYIYHNFIIFLMLFSLFFPYKNFQKKSILFLILFFHYVSHSIVHAETRYIITAMPAAILLTGEPLIWLKNNYIQLFKFFKSYFYFIFLILIIFIIGILKDSYWIRVLSINLTITLFALFIYLIASKFIEKKRAILSAFLFFTFFIISYNIFIIMDKDKDRGKIVLNERNPVLIHKIKFPENFDFERYDEAVLMIDMRSPENNYKIRIKVNDKIISEFTNGIPVQTNKLYLKGQKIEFYYYEKKWVQVPIPVEFLKQNEITIELNTQFNSKDSYLIIYTDKNNPANYFIGPSFYRNFRPFLYKGFNHTIWYRYFDSRFIEKVPVKSLKRESYILTKNGKKIRIKSDVRVYLLLKNRGGYYVKEEYYNYFERLYAGFLVFINPLEKGLVKWLDKPEKGFLPAGDTVRLYLQSEVDRYYTGYEVF